MIEILFALAVLSNTTGTIAACYPPPNPATACNINSITEVVRPPQRSHMHTFYDLRIWDVLTSNGGEYKPFTLARFPDKTSCRESLRDVRGGQYGICVPVNKWIPK